MKGGVLITMIRSKGGQGNLATSKSLSAFFVTPLFFNDAERFHAASLAP